MIEELQDFGKENNEGYVNCHNRPVLEWGESFAICWPLGIFHQNLCLNSFNVIIKAVWLSDCPIASFFLWLSIKSECSDQWMTNAKPT